MKKILFAFTCCALLATTSAFAQKSITLLHTSDTHSCIEPISKNDLNADQAGKAGYLRRAALVDSLRNITPDLLLLDCGDFSQGSAYYSLFKGEVEVKLMNLMRYDACAIGNHEFDNGLENMARLFRMAQFPIICSNYDFTDTPVEGLVKPYTIIERGGLRIGILGVSPRLEGLVAKATYGNTRYTDPAEAAQPIVDLLRKQEKCDLVICLSHLGYTDAPESDITFIQKTRGIDVVLGGHSHTYFPQVKYLPNADGHLIPLDHQGKNARFVGKIVLEY
ncbi:MAG: metallophosphatase [Bacteroidaceae bacterium]|nr:metallophosphatase [Bacteroidaceae bacterium]MDE6159231.1 metallophosphatase [Bacteroidaceae bacterium]